MSNALAPLPIADCDIVDAGLELEKGFEKNDCGCPVGAGGIDGGAVAWL